MMPARKPSIFATVAVATAVGVAAVMAFAGESLPDTDNGHYTLSQTRDGLLRLDTRSGQVSNCTHDDTGWACRVVPDERAAMDAEIGRLQAENEKLKAQLAAQGATQNPGATAKTDEALPKSDSSKKVEPKVAEGERNKIEIPLPNDQDMDRVMSFLERTWRRLIDMANRVQKDASGKI
jgi:hypothetical protein